MTKQMRMKYLSTAGLTVTSGLLLATLVGCQSQSNFSSLPAPTVEAPVSTADTTTVEHDTDQFVSGIQHGDYARVQDLMSPTFRAQMAAQKLAQAAHNEYKPFVSASGWNYDSVQAAGKGNRLIVHAHFTGAGQDTYRTNFSFVKSGTGWLIDSILAPSTPHAGKSAVGHMSTAPGH